MIKWLSRKPDVEWKAIVRQKPGYSHLWDYKIYNHRGRRVGSHYVGASRLSDAQYKVKMLMDIKIAASQKTDSDIPAGWTKV